MKNENLFTIHLHLLIDRGIDVEGDLQHSTSLLLRVGSILIKLKHTYIAYIHTNIHIYTFNTNIHVTSNNILTILRKKLYAFTYFTVFYIIYPVVGSPRKNKVNL